MIYVKAEAGCVSESEMSKVRELPKFDVDINMFGELVTRKMVELYANCKYAYADAVTGTLYNPKTGGCNSINIHIEQIYK
jgi:hypothetical protein